jgi:hypothetical protein
MTCPNCKNKTDRINKLESDRIDLIKYIRAMISAAGLPDKDEALHTVTEWGIAAIRCVAGEQKDKTGEQKMKKIVIKGNKGHKIVEIEETDKEIRGKCASYVRPLKLIITQDNDEKCELLLE